MLARAAGEPSPSTYSMSSSGVGEWMISAAMDRPHWLRRAFVERGLQCSPRPKQLRTYRVERRLPDVGDLLVGELFVFAEHQDLAIVLVERRERATDPECGVRIAGARIRGLLLHRTRHAERRLPAVGEQHVVGDAEHVRAEGAPLLIACRAFQDPDEGVLRELLGACGVGRPPPEEAPDRFAVAVEERLERRSRAGLYLRDQVLIADHACPSTG